MPFDGERRVFTRLITGLCKQPAVLDEFLTTLGILISEYDTSIRENRFIAGGATERILAATMRAVGIPNVVSRGLEPSDEDIVVDGLPISVKSSFTGKKDAIRLVNTLGQQLNQKWKIPTIFILADHGIGYADPVLLSNVVQTTRDALILRRQPLDELHIREPKWFFACAIPLKGRDSSQRRAVSETVATELMRRTWQGKPRFPNLSRHL